MSEGKMMIIKPDGTETVTDCAVYPEMMELRKLVGGTIAKVPQFKSIDLEEGCLDCVAFCNENGFPLKLEKNKAATQRLYEAAVQAQMLGPKGEVTWLVGDVAVFYGDKKIVRKLQKNW